LVASVFALIPQLFGCAPAARLECRESSLANSASAAEAPGATRLEQAEQEPARHRAERIAHAAEHRRSKTFQREQCTDVIARQGDRRYQDAGDGADGRRSAERQGRHRCGVDPDERPAKLRIGVLQTIASRQLASFSSALTRGHPQLLVASHGLSGFEFLEFRLRASPLPTEFRDDFLRWMVPSG